MEYLAYLITMCNKKLISFMCNLVFYRINNVFQWDSKNAGTKIAYPKINKILNK